jgi:hypothetical protein
VDFKAKYARNVLFQGSMRRKQVWKALKKEMRKSGSEKCTIYGFMSANPGIINIFTVGTV